MLSSSKRCHIAHPRPPRPWLRTWHGHRYQAVGSLPVATAAEAVDLRIAAESHDRPGVPSKVKIRFVILGLLGTLLSLDSIAIVSLQSAVAQSPPPQSQPPSKSLQSLVDLPLDFGLHIRPILSEHCFHCHGPDPAHRQADLRLDDEASARTVIQAGDPSGSELWRRVVSHNPDEVMPPPSARKTVTDEQKDRLKQWIESGATWGPHWSLAPPVSHPLPQTSNDPWARTPIDAWVLDALRRHRLSPAPASDPYTLARRLSLDLIGLPPSWPRVQQFVQDYERDRSRAVENWVDELLARPEFGEHWARMWLDLARYADTKGYEKDLKRDMWPYRDWVIDALNRDMPFDQFTVEQLAGDMLDNPSQSQRVATAFHRATLSNDEGGTDDEEFRIAAVKDRIDTTIQVWMGLTMGCAKCHSHKYDPITIEDYYRFFAIFNQTEDADRYDDEPRLAMPSFEQQSMLVQLEQQRRLAAETLQHVRGEQQAKIDAKWQVPSVANASADSQAGLQIESDRSVVASPDRPERDTYILELNAPQNPIHFVRLEALMSTPTPEQPSGLLGLNPSDPNFVVSEFRLERGKPNAAGAFDWELIALGEPKASFEQTGWPIASAIDGDAKTGWAVSPQQRQSHWAIFSLSSPVSIAEPERLRVTVSQQYGNRLMLRRLRISTSHETDGPLDVNAIPEVKSAADELSSIDKKIASLRESMPRLPVMKELAAGAKRTTRIHQRGSFLDPGEEVAATVPALFSPQSPMQAPNRLTAALWLMDKNNPLTPRVTANRIWAHLFGKGLVETEEDFGSQGALPSHPELLDGLAVQFRDEFGWSLKKLIRSIVLTNTYQQSFLFDEARRERDPQNRWLSRSSRFRLSAETVRDQTLAAAGLLSSKQGGPPVMPPQPEGLWRSTYSGARWITSPGEDRYRRGIYTFWKRTTPYPSMETFDATTREVCQIRRIPTNTPLQALVTLNDPVYVEASLAMAQRWWQLASSDVERLERGFPIALARPITESERRRLQDLLARSRQHFVTREGEAQRLLEQAAFPLDPSIPVNEIAAWSVVTSTIINLDEFLMRP